MKFAWVLLVLVSFLKQNAVEVLNITILKQAGTVGEILKLRLIGGLKKVHRKQQMQDFSTIFVLLHNTQIEFQYLHS